MPIGKGFQGILGVKKEVAYAQEIAVTKAIPMVSEDCSVDIERIEDEVLRGRAGAGDHLAGNIKYPISFKAKLTYADLDFLIAHAMGAAAAPAVNGSLYNHSYTLAEEISTAFTTAIYKGVSVWAFAGCKVDKMKISGKANQPLDIDFSGSGHYLSMSSVVNTAGVLQALSTQDTAAKVMFSDLVFKIATQGTALSGVTASGLAAFTFDLDNKLKNDDFDNRSLYNMEPVRDGIRSVSLDLDVSRYEADTYLAWYHTATVLHAQLLFSAGLYSFQIDLPKITITSVSAPISGPGLIKQQIKCRCHRDPGSLSSSFTDQEEFAIKVTNARSTGALA